MRKWKQLGFNVIKDSFDQLPTAVCFFDPLGRIVLCNRQMYRLSQHLFQRDMQYLGEVEAGFPARWCEKAFGYGTYLSVSR